MAEDFSERNEFLKKMGMGLDAQKPKDWFGKEETFKFQKPMFTTEQYPLVQVHNERKTWMGHLPLTEQLNQLFVGEYKFYVRAIPQKDGQLWLMEFVDNPGW